MAGFQACDKPARQDSGESEYTQTPTAPTQPARYHRCRAALKQLVQHPEHIQIDRNGEAQMRGQPVLTDVRYLYKPALHHVPAHKPLQTTQNKHSNKVRYQWA